MRQHAFDKISLVAPGASMRVAVSAAVILFLSVASAQAADAAHGAQVFKACAPCHSTEAGQRSFMGPNLNGVVGRKAGSTDFPYSARMKSAGLDWTPANLDAYLQHPSAVVPGNRMAFGGLPSEVDRADVIAFLKTKGGK